MAGQHGFADEGGHPRTAADVPSMCHCAFAGGVSDTPQFSAVSRTRPLNRFDLVPRQAAFALAANGTLRTDEQTPS